MSHLLNVISNCYQLFLSIFVIWLLAILFAIGLVLLLIEFPFPKSDEQSDPEEVAKKTLKSHLIHHI